MTPRRRGYTDKNSLCFLANHPSVPNGPFPVLVSASRKHLGPRGNSSAMTRELTRHWLLSKETTQPWREHMGGRSQEGYSERRLSHMYSADPRGSDSEGPRRVGFRGGEKKKLGDSSSLVLSLSSGLRRPRVRGNMLVATAWENFLAQIRSHDTTCLSFTRIAKSPAAFSDGSARRTSYLPIAGCGTKVNMLTLQRQGSESRNEPGG